MSTPQPQRREQRRTHLDASVVPVERALLARAGALDESAAAPPEPSPDEVRAEKLIADEFRALAEELHYW